MTKKKISVAIVEDKNDIRTSLQSLINSSDNCRCDDVFASAEEALEQIPAIEPDVVLMDIQLPQMNGIECIRRIREQNTKIQFMMMTVYEDSDNVFHSLAAGATGYLLKNSSPSKILESIVELNEGGSPMSSEIARRVVSSFHPVSKQVHSEVLSPRENEIAALLAKGFLYKEIAERLSITIGTVKQHIHKIYEKLQVINRTEALNKLYPDQHSAFPK